MQALVGALERYDADRRSAIVVTGVQTFRRCDPTSKHNGRRSRRSCCSGSPSAEKFGPPVTTMAGSTGRRRSVQRPDSACMSDPPAH